MRCSREKLAQRLRGNDAGFTLVEVSVIVVIIGVLSGCRDPDFLSQQSRAQTASISSDLRSAATAMEPITRRSRHTAPRPT